MLGLLFFAPHGFLPWGLLRLATHAQPIACVAAAAAAWTGLYLGARRMFAGTAAPHEGRRYAERAVAWLHALASAALSLAVLCTHGDVLASDRLLAWCPAGTWVCILSAGYFAWDIGISVRHHHGPAFVFHGVACFAAYTAGVAAAPFMQPYLLLSLQHEWSTVFLHPAWLLHKRAVRGWLQKLCVACLLATFGGVRILVNSAMMVVATWDALCRWGKLTAPQAFTIAAGCAAGWALLAMNVCWFAQLVALVRPDKRE